MSDTDGPLVIAVDSSTTSTKASDAAPAALGRASELLATTDPQHAH